MLTYGALEMCFDRLIIWMLEYDSQIYLYFFWVSKVVLCLQIATDVNLRQPRMLARNNEVM